MSPELRHFIPWFLKTLPFRGTTELIWEKVASRTIHRSIRHYGFDHYPERLKQSTEVALAESLNSPQWKLGGRAIAAWQGKPPQPLLTLAGCQLELEKDIDWELGLTDPEDMESLHRFNWMIHWLSSSANVDEQAVGWIWNQWENWVDVHNDQAPFRPDSENLVWESYTVAERISNTVLLATLTETQPTEKIIRSLGQQLRFLATRMEFRGPFTGNHVINDARGLYLGGVARGEASLKSLAREVFETMLPEMITPDGFLREGSSHYQLLFTRWCLEVTFFARLSGDEVFLEWLRSWCAKLLEKCHFFLVEATDQSLRMPYIGDISPDFPPAWLQNMTESALVHSKGKALSGWSALWKKTTPLWSKFPELSQSAGSFPESGWYRLEQADWCLFAHLENELPPKYVGHFHHDAYHFDLFYQGWPLLVDAGRKTYDPDSEASEFGISPQAHNVLTIDGLGVIPLKPHRFPADYSKSHNQLDVTQTNSSTQCHFSATGWQRLGRKLKVQRTLELSKGQAELKDQVEGASGRLLQWFFHWAPEVQWQGEASLLEEVLQRSFMLGSRRGKVAVVLPSGVNARWVSGEDSLTGKVSRRYGSSLDSSTLVLEGKAAESVCLKLTIEWS